VNGGELRELGAILRR